MRPTLSCLFVLLLLTGCSGIIGSSARQFSTSGKLEMGHRMELRMDFDEPMQSNTEPCPERREIYDQDRKSSSVFDQSFSLLGSFKF